MGGGGSATDVGNTDNAPSSTSSTHGIEGREAVGNTGGGALNGGDVLGDGDKEEEGDVDEERDDTNTTTAEGGIISNSTSKGGAEDMDIEVEEEENDGELEEEVVEEENNGGSMMEEEAAAAAHHLAAVAEEEVEEDDVLLVQQQSILDAVHAKLKDDGMRFGWGIDKDKANEIIGDTYNLFLEMDRGFDGYPVDEIAQDICQRIDEDGKTVSICIPSSMHSFVRYCMYSKLPVLFLNTPLSYR